MVYGAATLAAPMPEAANQYSEAGPLGHGGALLVGGCEPVLALPALCTGIVPAGYPVVTATRSVQDVSGLRSLR